MTPKEISDKIERVMNEILTEENGYDEGDMIVEWALISYVTNPNQEKLSAYPMFFSNGELPGYRARGLFHTALLFLDAPDDEDEDDEETA